MPTKATMLGLLLLMLCINVTANAADATAYQCSVCGHVYNPITDGGGKAFADLPDSWTCPVCGAPKSSYKPQTLPDGTVVWVHVHDNDDAASPVTPAVILNNGVSMPAIAAGTWQYSSAVAEQSVTAALASGYRHIDTAHDCKLSLSLPPHTTLPLTLNLSLMDLRAHTVT